MAQASAQPRGSGEQRAHEIMAAIERELGEGWRAKLSRNPTPAQEVEAFAADAGALHEAHERFRARRRAELIAWHRDELAQLEEAA
jgi:hypothetical protein